MIEYSRELIKGDVQVVLENIGEGWGGDYDADDPDDVNLLRFTVLKRSDLNAPEGYQEWEQVENASYCIQIPYDISDEKADKILEYIMYEVYSNVVNDISIKKKCEWLSWTNGE